MEEDTETPQPVPLVAPLGEGEISWIARGRAKVVKPGPVRARALVPGALSIPRAKPSRDLRLGQASAPFPRRVFPERGPEAGSETPPETPPEVRSETPDPTVSSEVRSETPDPVVSPEVRSETPDPAVPPAIRAATPGDPALIGTSRPVRETGPGTPPPAQPRRKRRAALPVAVAAVAALAAAGGYLVLTDRLPAGLNRWAGAAETSATASASPATTTQARAERPAGDPFGSVAAAPTGPPTRLRIGAIKVDTPLETLTIGSDGALQPPKKFADAGWYAAGTAPGDTGPAVIAGHVDSRSGPAVFYRLRELAAGDRVDVTRGGEIITFTVTAIRWYPKSEFPTEEVYGPTPDRQLRLITCGGVFDRSLRSYRDNLVVYAVAG